MRCSLLLIAALLLAAVAPAAAQVRIEGRVIDDESLSPIPGATVYVFDSHSRQIDRQITDENGEFTFRLTQHDGYRFNARRIGYRTASTPPLWTDGNRFFSIEIRLDPDAVLLAPIEVVARGAGASPVTAGFRHRLNNGMGYYITRDDIDRRKPVRVTDMVATAPGVRLESSGSGASRTIYVSRAAGRCPAQIFVDGFHLNNAPTTSGPDTGVNLDAVVAPGDVEGIEVYRGTSTIPATFLNRYSHCGVIAVWTRRGG